MFVRMNREHTYDVADQPGVTRTLPAGWVGEVDDEVGEAAVKAGAAENTAPKSEKAAKPMTDKEAIATFSADEKAAYDKMDDAGKSKAIADKKAASAADE